MLLFISFLILMAGSINWLLIGLLQYDFVAGIFGYQGSVFSRLIYIVIGAGALFFLFKVIMQKGKIELFNFKKKNKKKQSSKEADRDEEFQPKHHGGYDAEDGISRYNAEASTEHFRHYDDYGPNMRKEEYDNLFDEYFSDDN